MPVKVSKTAYAALQTLQSNLDIAKANAIRFPDLGTAIARNQSIAELVKNNVIQKHGQMRNATYSIITDLSEVEESQRAPRGSKTSGATATSSLPFQAPKAKPTVTKTAPVSFTELEQFVKTVRENLENGANIRREAQEKKIAELQNAIVKAGRDIATLTKATKRLTDYLGTLEHENTRNEQDAAAAYDTVSPGLKMVIKQILAVPVPDIPAE